MGLIYRGQKEGTGTSTLYAVVHWYKLSKRRWMGDDEGDDDHQQLYTYGTGKRLKMMLRVQTPAK